MRRLLALVALSTGAAACTENLDSGAACPALCPVENAAVVDTVLDAVSLDSTVAGFPVPGETATLLLALRPGADSLDVRAIVRFDSLVARYFPPAGGDSLTITRVDSTTLSLRLDTSGTRFTAPLTIEAYDVDTSVAAADTATAALTALFRPARRLGSITLQPGPTVIDSIRLRLSDTAFVNRTQGSRRLRIGLRLVSTAPAQLRLRSFASGGSADGPRLTYDPAPDTLFQPVVLSPRSVTPTPAQFGAAFTDFTITSRAPRSAFGSDLVVGGAPSERVFMRFDVPRRLADSTTIVRATLELVQRPARGVLSTDSVTIRSQAVTATDAVTDVRRAANLLASSSLVGTDSLRLSPSDSGRRVVAVVQLVKVWRTLPEGTQRALVLRSALEGSEAGEVRFFSREAAPALRPRLRLSYIPRSDVGLP
jgi:hypothetical protein